MKRLTSLLLMFLLFCTRARCETLEFWNESGRYQYILLEDGTAEITGYGGDETDLIVPAELDGHPVSSIGPGALAIQLMLTSVTIPEGVTSLGMCAFSESYFLTSITLPGSLTTIGDQAFYGCGSLTSITLPDGITAIGENPFVDCYRLTEIIVSPDHPLLEVTDGVLFSKTGQKLICYPFAFEADSYTIPKGTQTIGASAFHSNPYLTRIFIPDSVVSIEDYAFSHCSALTTFIVVHGSYAEQWCMDNALPCISTAN